MAEQMAERMVAERMAVQMVERMVAERMAGLGAVAVAAGYVDPVVVVGAVAVAAGYVAPANGVATAGASLVVAAVARLARCRSTC
jgi:phosphotransacetylase